MEKPSLSPDSESLLISQAIDGDARAVGVLYDRYLNLVYNYVYYRIGRPVETEQVTERIFYKVFDNLYRFPKEGKGHGFLTWIFKFASQEVTRFQKKHPSLGNDMQETFQDIQQENLIRALKKLDETDYQLVVSRFFNGLNVEATAKLVGTTSEQIKIFQLRAIKALEKLMKKDGQNG